MTDRPVWLISPDKVHDLHLVGLREHGGADGVREPGGVERVIDAALGAALYLAESPDHGPDVLNVAAALLFYIARAQIFTDGNKRVAWMVCLAQLQAEGLTIDATSGEAVDIVLAAANDKVRREDIAQWLADRLTAWDP